MEGAAWLEGTGRFRDSAGRLKQGYCNLMPFFVPKRSGSYSECEASLRRAPSWHFQYSPWNPSMVRSVLQESSEYLPSEI